MIRSRNFKDLTGQKFNHLTAIKLDEIRMSEYKIKFKWVISHVASF